MISDEIDESPLYKLPPNKTFTFHFKNKVGGRQFVRTGTYSDGNCFIHSILRCISQEYRRNKDSKIHLELVKSFRKSLSNWINMDIFKTLGNGEFSKILFTSKLLQIIRDNDIDPENKVHVIINYILTPNIIEHKILPEAMSGNESFYMQFFTASGNYLMNKLDKILDADKLKHVLKELPAYFLPIFKTAFDTSLSEFKEKLMKDGEFVDSTQMECISLFIGMNLVFFDGTSMEGYAGGNDVVKFDESKKTLIFLWIEENHFEVFGELLDSSTINRIFSPKDPIIYSILKKEN